MKSTFFRDAFFLARAGLRIQLQARETVLWTFVMPLVFMYFIGTVTGHAFGGSDLRRILGVNVPSDAGPLADSLIDGLNRAGFRVMRSTSDADFRQFPSRLAIPPAFTESVLSGKPVKVRFEHTAQAAGSESDNFRITRALYACVADRLFGQREPRLLLEVQSAGKLKLAPSGFQQSVPGTMVMFTLLVMFSSGAATLTIERRGGQLRRLASTPMARGSVVLGRWGARMALGVVQIAFAMVAGTALFHVHWGPNLPMVAAVLLAYGALAVSLGMLLGNFGRTEGQVVATGVLLSNVLAALGGCWWPIEITPKWAQHAAVLLPTGWTMDALHKLVNFGASPVEALPHLAASVVGAVVMGWIVSRSFRFA